jgi:hypothetical protein
VKIIRFFTSIFMRNLWIEQRSLSSGRVQIQQPPSHCQAFPAKGYSAHIGPGRFAAQPPGSRVMGSTQRDSRQTDAYQKAWQIDKGSYPTWKGSFKTLDTKSTRMYKPGTAAVIARIKDE